MATNESMTDERLANMKEHYRTYGGIRMGELLAEVDRLRAACKSIDDAGQTLMIAYEQVRAENAAMRPVVEAVAEHIGGYVSEHFRQCAFCGNGAIESRIIAHANGCEVEQARAFVATHPATDTTSEARERGRGR